MRTEIEVRLLEAKRLEEVARSGLRALLNLDSGEDLDVDDEDFEPLEVPNHPLAYYEEQARLSRPEVRTLEYAVKAKRALASLEHRKLYPDLVLIGQISFAYAPTIDSPQNAFANNPFNGYGGGVAAALRLPLDFGPKLARGERTRAEAGRDRGPPRGGAGRRRLRGQQGLPASCRRPRRGSLRCARARRPARPGWRRSRRTSRSGWPDSRDFSDALLQSFKMRTFALQAVYDLNDLGGLPAFARATGAADPRIASERPG